MGIYYNPPQPPMASNAGTPPEPHAPIPSQGNQPPFRQVAAAVMMASVLAAWPADAEPRLQFPNNQQRKIAPLTLAFEPQPPQIGTSQATQRVIYASWPSDLEPRLSLPNNRQVSIAPLTFTYGSQPPIVGTRPVTSGQLIGSWPLDFEPRLIAPNNTRVNIAPLTLLYGDQPPLIASLTRTDLETIDIWPQPDWPSQNASRSLAWYVPPIPVITDQPYRAFPYGLILAGWSADLEPRLNRPNDQQQKIAPLTLTYGDAPTPRGALTPTQLQIITAWPLDLEPRLGRPNDRQQTIVPLTFVYGDAPNPRGPLSTPTLVAIITPAQTWAAQTFAKNAAWNVTGVVPATSPNLILVDGRWAMRLHGILYTWID